MEKVTSVYMWLKLIFLLFAAIYFSNSYYHNLNTGFCVQVVDVLRPPQPICYFLAIVLHVIVVIISLIKDLPQHVFKS